MVQLFATPGLKALAQVMIRSPEQVAWVLKFQQKQFHDALPEGQKAHFRSFLGPIIDKNFLNEPSSAEAFAQIASELFEEVTRNTHCLPETEALDVPVNLIWGQADPYLSTAVAEDFRSQLKHVSFHLISAGHWLQIDAPDQVAEVMLS